MKKNDSGAPLIRYAASVNCMTQPQLTLFGLQTITVEGLGRRPPTGVGPQNPWTTGSTRVDSTRYYCVSLALAALREFTVSSAHGGTPVYRHRYPSSPVCFFFFRNPLFTFQLLDNRRWVPVVFVSSAVIRSAAVIRRLSRIQKTQCFFCCVHRLHTIARSR